MVQSMIRREIENNERKREAMRQIYIQVKNKSKLCGCGFIAVY